MGFGKLVGYEKKEAQIQLQYEKQDVIVEVLSEQVIHVLATFRKESCESKAIEGEKGKDTAFTVDFTDGVLELKTSRIWMKATDEFVVDFFQADGTPLMEEYRGCRVKNEAVSKKMIALLEAEGHDTSSLGRKEHPVMTVKKLDTEDCFYGLGDKTGFLNKRNYEYENWNSDIPQAHTDDFHALYKSIPFLMCLKEKGAYGVFFDNTFHSYLNLGKESGDYFYYAADGGNLDYYFMEGDTLVDLIREYTGLTGRTPLPQRWTLGHQQSRWGYECAADIREIAEKYREYQIPCDAIHFDIDYMDNYKVFTFDEKEYGPKGEIFDEIKTMGYKPVAIVDPGIKVEEGYFMSDEGLENDYFAKDKDGEVYINRVWPGDSYFPDFGREEVRKWWGDHHKDLMDIGLCGIWNDMNEPASFNGPLPEDVVFHDETRKTNHAEIHNVYGHFMSKATFQGIKEATGERPFVITRACYSGTQKYATVWTGDNQSLWAHLQMMVPQLCNLGMSGFSFCGTDIGGFGADATPELMSRWIQAAAFSPLFRNHSAKGTRRQEPWQLGQQVIDIYRKYVEIRYKFIPYIYDLFYQGEKTGLPIMRPLVLHYPQDKNTHELNGEFLVGENLLVAPVLEQGATRKTVYLPEGTWYDYWTGEAVRGGEFFLREAPIDVCPMYIKAGSIIPTYEPMQYLGEREKEVLHLLVTPEVGKYVHFQDNGRDYEYQNGAYNLYEFVKEQNGQLTTNMLHEGYDKYSEILVDYLG